MNILYAKISAPEACALAIKSTIFKADLQVNDTDRDYYELHKLTLARHPSETDERMMLRLLVFGKHAHEYLEFAGSISTEETFISALTCLYGAQYIKIGPLETDYSSIVRLNEIIRLTEAL